MHVVMLHYHLNRGGVTRVIENHLRALATAAPAKASLRVTIAHGGRQNGWDNSLAQELPFPLEIVSLPALDYDSLHPGDEDTDLSEQLGLLLDSQQCVPHQTVLHVHNHTLGKNSSYCGALQHLAQQGWRLLLQIHDFPEDLRPENYAYLCQQAGSMPALHAQLYPQAAHIQYAVLNSRDQHKLQTAGVRVDGLALLPNPVPHVVNRANRADAREALRSAFNIDPQRRYVLYPVRGIRRKNLGELCLWSMLVQESTFALTLSPLNPIELAPYETWRQFAHQLKLDVRFGVGDGPLSFEQQYAAADAILTTSVAEGFGMVFLEAPLMDRPLVGRELPGVSDDFLEAGVRLPGIGPGLQVPGKLIDRDAMKKRFVELSNWQRHQYGLPNLSLSEMDETLEPIFASATFDFGRLDGQHQRELLQQLQQQPAWREEICQLNPTVQTLRDPGKLAECIEPDNRQAITAHYSLPVIGRQLCELYQQLLEATPGQVEQRADIAESILTQSVQPAALFPIRLES